MVLINAQFCFDFNSRYGQDSMKTGSLTNCRIQKRGHLLIVFDRLFKLNL